MFYFILSIYPPKSCFGRSDFSDRHIWRNAVRGRRAVLLGCRSIVVLDVSWLVNASAKKASLKWWLWQRYKCPTTTSETIFANLELVRGFSIEDFQRPFELIRSEGSLSHPENGGHRVSTKMLEATCQALWNVSAARAQSSVAADKYQIWEGTANESFRITIKGVGAERWFKGFIDDNGANALAVVFSNFDRYIKSLLSTTMLKVLMARGDFASAAMCCLPGAVMLQKLREEPGWTACCCRHPMLPWQSCFWSRVLMRGQQRTMVPQLWCLLPKVAMRPWPSCCYSMLLRWGQQCIAMHDGRTALMIARANRHEAVPRLLREHGGDQHWFRRWLFG